MLPHRFYLRPDRPHQEPREQTFALLKQASVALVAVLLLALVVAFATEMLSLLTPTDAVAVVP